MHYCIIQNIEKIGQTQQKRLRRNICLSFHEKAFELAPYAGALWSVDAGLSIAVFQMIFPGAPCVFYGDENGLAVVTGPEYRRPMEWEYAEDGWFAFTGGPAGAKCFRSGLQSGDGVVY